MTKKCVFCDSNAIGGWIPSFGKAGICIKCISGLSKKLNVEKPEPKMD